jgi:hypothetical protein
MYIRILSYVRAYACMYVHTYDVCTCMYTGEAGEEEEAGEEAGETTTTSIASSSEGGAPAADKC